MFRRRFIALCLALVPLLGAVYVSPPVAEFVVGAVDQLAPMSEAVALTPVQRAILKRGVSPVYQCNYLAGALCGAESFSRAGNAMQFDSSGYLTYAPNNLLTYSNTFSNVAWTPTQGGVSQVPLVTDNYGTDPLGGSTAARIVLRLNGGTTSSDISYLTRSVSSAAAGLSSVWMKSTDGISALKVNLRGDFGAAVQKTVTGTWQQFYVTGAAGAVDRFQISIYGNDAGVSNTTDILVWSAVSAAVTYETSPRAADQVITTSSAYYGPRIDYDPNTLAVRGLLVEPPATNYWTNSEDATAWVKTNLTATVAPAGLYGSVALATLTVTGNGMAVLVLPPIAVAAGQQVSHTVALLAGSVSTAEVGLYGFTSSWGLAADASCVVLSGPGVATRHSGGLFNITNLSASTPTLVRVTRTYLAAENAQAYVYLGSNGVRTAGETIKVGTPQTEFGAGSSYIISGASPTTRAAETVQLTGAALSTLQGGSWTAFVETGPMAGYEPAASTILGANNTQSALYVADATNFASYNGSSVLTATIGNSGNFLTGGVRSGVSTDASGRSIVANGGAVSSDGNRATPVAVTSAYLGSFNGAYSINGPVKSFAIYNQRLPDATLQSKSVVNAAY